MNMRCAQMNCGDLTRKPDIEPWAIHDHSQRFESFLVNQVSRFDISLVRQGLLLMIVCWGVPLPSLQRLNGLLK